MALTECFAIFLDGPANHSPAMHDKGFAFPYLWDFEYPPRDGPGATHFGHRHDATPARSRRPEGVAAGRESRPLG